MKIINKIRNKKLIMLALCSTFIVSCSDYLDVDKDTDYPTTAPLSLLLSNVQRSTSFVGGFNNNTGRLLSTYTHQMTSREEEDQYGIKVNNIPMNNDWDAIYLALTDIETIIKQGTDTGNMVYVGVAQMEKAYIMSYAVDLWGDVPYSEATQLATSGIINPNFDNQKDIYNNIFTLIETAKTNLGSDLGTEKPGTDDLHYGGNTAKWIKFANTFKLKLYNQTHLSPNFDQVGFDNLIAENNFFTSNADDFQFVHYDAISPSNERNQLFVEAYESTQFGSYQSPWFYEILKGVNPNIMTGNPDPRMPYYFFNQLTAGQFPPGGNTTTGNPGADYWDISSGFFSIRFGSTGPDRDKSEEGSYTYPGIFPSGGRYDDGQGGSVETLNTGFSGKGKAPHRILTYDEFLYIQAELIHDGKLTGNESTKLEEAITASFAKVDQVVAGSGTNQVVPVLTGSASVTTFINNVMTDFNTASPSKKLEIIMTQKWVGTFGDPMDQYTDYRRTGYPVLANPLGASPEYQLDNGNGFPLIDSQTVQNNAFQLSFYWPQSELNANSNAPAQKNPAVYKIFWDN